MEGWKENPGSRREMLRSALAVSGLVAGREVLRGAEQNTPGRGSSAKGKIPPDLAWLSLEEAAFLVRRKAVSPVELTQTCLERIEKLNPVLNAFIAVTAETAMAQAREAEAEIRSGNWRGPLHGIPIALKDLFDTAGVRTTAASALFADRIPQQDAEVVRRLKLAGAVLLGKLNMSEFAYSETSVISHFGVIRNPWKPDRIAGGSSGGSAAAVAAALCYGALGSDTGGSIREPAAFSNIVGLKPTYGRVSTRGVIPLSWSLDHVGPMTRTVADAAILLQAIAGYDPYDTTTVDVPVPDFRSGLKAKPSSIRCGVPRAVFFDKLDPDVEAAVDKAIAMLGDMTAGIREVTLPDIPSLPILGTEAHAYHAEYLAKSPDLYQPATLRSLQGGGRVATPAYIHARRHLDRLRRVVQNVFSTVDLLITPTTPVPAPTIEEIQGAKRPKGSPGLLRNTTRFNVYGLPSVSVPCGFTSAGLPVGLQISGPNWSEAKVLALAYAYEQATPWHRKHPDLRIDR
jgi:aspartyl-tRNA(Asn)/glutamyl-tRNA(Gln) amidotransferase subunit A